MTTRESTVTYIATSIYELATTYAEAVCDLGNAGTDLAEAVAAARSAGDYLADYTDFPELDAASDAALEAANEQAYKLEQALDAAGIDVGVLGEGGGEASDWDVTPNIGGVDVELVDVRTAGVDNRSWWNVRVADRATFVTAVYLAT